MNATSKLVNEVSKTIRHNKTSILKQRHILPKVGTKLNSSLNQTNAPSFYQKLNSYFPTHEMKKLDHFVALLADKSHIYKIDESSDHVLVYSLIDNFLFVDYVWVSERSRGKGLGSKILQKLKSYNRIIILEVEQIESEYIDLMNEYRNKRQQLPKEVTDKIDAVKRLKFYKREGFKHANQVQYNRLAALTREECEMEILYWEPKGAQNTQKEILRAMRLFYEEIHKHRDLELYGWEFEAPHEVLQLRPPSKDLLSTL